MPTTAQMGFVGHVKFSFNEDPVIVRATSAQIRASQEIDMPDVVDGRIDRTLYGLKPKIVGGPIAFPLVHEGVGDGKNCGSTVNFGKRFWQAASGRDVYGRLKEQFNVHVRYNDSTAFTYPSCIINTMSIEVRQGESVNFNCDLIGGASSEGDPRREMEETGDDIEFLSPARIVMWSDFVIKLWGDDIGGEGGNFAVNGDEIRSFSVTLNNNAERYYTLNNRLAPQDVTARKRQISGNIALMGRNVALSDLAWTNENRYTSNSAIAFGYTLGASANPYWATALLGVIFKIEEIEINNDLIETRIEWHALADCEMNYEATQIGTDSGTNPLAKPTANNYGGPTAPGFPGF